MPKALFTLEAREDLKEIKNYIAEDSKQAAIAYVKLLRQKSALLASSPKIGTEEAGYCGLRKFPTGNYLIFYRERDKDIEVIRILHTARDVEAIFNK